MRVSVNLLGWPKWLTPAFTIVVSLLSLATMIVNTIYDVYPPSVNFKFTLVVSIVACQWQCVVQEATVLIRFHSVCVPRSSQLSSCTIAVGWVAAIAVVAALCRPSTRRQLRLSSRILIRVASASATGHWHLLPPHV